MTNPAPNKHDGPHSRRPSLGHAPQRAADPVRSTTVGRPHNPGDIPNPEERSRSSAHGGRICTPGKLARSHAKAARTKSRTKAARLNQYYTRAEIAEHSYAILQDHFDPEAYLMVEPSAGTGAFLNKLPPGSRGYDIEPRCRGVKKADFLKVELKSDRPICVIGNPPFGKNASTAVRFFNHAARTASVIAMIFPRSFRKASIENRLDRNFHLVREEMLPEHAFLFLSKPHNVPVIFQIWERRPEPRELRKVQTRHADFEFTTYDRADFVIQRVGARAGRLYHDFTVSKNSHYFIRSKVERFPWYVQSIMSRLSLATAAADTAGNPSLAKSELVSMYRKWVEEQADS